MTNNVHDNTERHRFELEADGHIAFANYKRADGVLTMLHTEVPKALEGRGIGSTLIRGVLDAARSEGLKVDPAVPLREGLYRKASGIRRPAPVNSRPRSFRGASEPSSRTTIEVVPA